jgi:uncharacterized protein (DUF1501 family)
MSYSSTRRDFLKQLGTSGLVSLGAMPPSFLVRAAETAASVAAANQRVLVLIQMAGGNDGLNTLVPYGDDAYYKARPGIGIPKAGLLTINDHLGLHPRLTGLKELYDEGKLALVQGVGYPQPDRSHFRSMDIWQSAQPLVEAPRDGWLGRALEWQFDRAPGQAEALTLGTDKLPLAFVSGRVTVPTLRRLEDFQLRDGNGPASHLALKREALNRVSELVSLQGKGELDFLRRTTTTALTSADRLKSLGAAYKPTVEYPASGLANQLKLIAQMIVAELPARVYFVTLDGFDTHAQQEGGHAALLAELGGAVRAFERDLSGHCLADRVLLSTFSEFGRRVAENGSLGTDHGAGSMLFAMTPAKAGLYGTYPSLTDLNEGDLKHTVDFRSVYASLLKWLQIPSEPVLGDGFAPLGFV